MPFDRAFSLLNKFTVGIPRSDPVETKDIILVTEYLGIEPQDLPLPGQIELIERELSDQNRFLTKHLWDADIERSELYHRSQFVREVVLNSRKKLS